MFLRKLLPQNHLSDESKGIVMIAMGLVATMTALVLGLLISSAKSSFDALSHEITGTLSDIILLDRTLALYGTETEERRDVLRSAVANGLDLTKMKQNGVPAHWRYRLGTRTLSSRRFRDSCRRMTGNVH